MRLDVPADDTRRIFSESHENITGQTGGATVSSVDAKRDFRRNNVSNWPAWGSAAAEAEWLRRAQVAATAYCKSEGYQRATKVTVTHRDNSYNDAEQTSVGISGNWQVVSFRNFNHFATVRKVNTWSAVCTKKVRGPRR